MNFSNFTYHLNIKNIYANNNKKHYIYNKKNKNVISRPITQRKTRRM